MSPAFIPGPGPGPGFVSMSPPRSSSLGENVLVSKSDTGQCWGFWLRIERTSINWRDWLWFGLGSRMRTKLWLKSWVFVGQANDLCPRHDCWALLRAWDMFTLWYLSCLTFTDTCILLERKQRELGWAVEHRPVQFAGLEVLVGDGVQFLLCDDRDEDWEDRAELALQGSALELALFTFWTETMERRKIKNHFSWQIGACVSQKLISDEDWRFTLSKETFPFQILLVLTLKMIFFLRSIGAAKNCDHSPPLSTIDPSPKPYL